MLKPFRASLTRMPLRFHNIGLISHFQKLSKDYCTFFLMTTKGPAEEND